MWCGQWGGREEDHIHPTEHVVDTGCLKARGARERIRQVPKKGR